MIEITTKRNQKIILPRKEEIIAIYMNERKEINEGATIHLRYGGTLIVNIEELKKIIKWLE